MVRYLSYDKFSTILLTSISLKHEILNDIVSKNSKNQGLGVKCFLILGFSRIKAPPFLAHILEQGGALIRGT